MQILIHIFLHNHSNVYVEKITLNSKWYDNLAMLHQNDKKIVSNMITEFLFRKIFLFNTPLKQTGSHID